MLWVASKRVTRRPQWVAASLLLAGLLAVGGLACSQQFDAGAEPRSESIPTASAPAFDLAGLDGERYRLVDFSGRVLLVEFWATWCGPCRLQAEILDRLYAEFPRDEVEFLAVSLGEPEDVVRGFVAEDPFPYPLAIDPEETLGYALEIAALPTVLIVDRDGRIVYLRPGISDAATLRAELSAAIAALDSA